MVKELVEALRTAGEPALASQLEAVADYTATTAYQAMLRHPNAYIHFTRGVPASKDSGVMVPKLGVNPMKREHHDPPGVYFYPIEWMLKKKPSFIETLYRTDSAFYYIADIDFTADGLDLVDDGEHAFTVVAKRNGWLDQLEWAWANEDEVDAQAPVKRDRSDDTAGGVFYDCADILVNKDDTGWRWMQLLKGVDYLYDSGRGIINPAEPAQVCVLNPACITVLEQGSNAAEPMDRQFLAEMQKLVGGTITWHNKIATLVVQLHDKPISVLVKEVSNRRNEFVVSLAYFVNGFQHVDNGWVSLSDDSYPQTEARDLVDTMREIARRADVTRRGKPPQWWMTQKASRNLLLQLFDVYTVNAHRVSVFQNGPNEYGYSYNTLYTTIVFTMALDTPKRVLINMHLTDASPANVRLMAKVDADVNDLAAAATALRAQLTESFERQQQAALFADRYGRREGDPVTLSLNSMWTRMHLNWQRPQMSMDDDYESFGELTKPRS